MENQPDYDVVQFDVPDGKQWADGIIIEAGFNLDLGRIYVVYEIEEPGENQLAEDQIVFTGCDYKDGQPVLNHDGIPVGILSPQQAINTETPGANEAEALYDILEGLGVRVYDQL